MISTFYVYLRFRLLTKRSSFPYDSFDSRVGKSSIKKEVNVGEERGGSLGTRYLNNPLVFHRSRVLPGVLIRADHVILCEATVNDRDSRDYFSKNGHKRISCEAGESVKTFNKN